MSNNLFLGEQHALSMLERAHEARLPGIKIDPLIFDDVERVREDEVKDKYFELLELFYPDAYLYIDEGAAPIALRPSFRVVCDSPEKLALAYALRPSGIDADIVPDYPRP